MKRTAFEISRAGVDPLMLPVYVAREGAEASWRATLAAA
jgi:hypothetical protein